MYHVFLANHLLLSPNKILHDRQSQKLHLTSPKLAARLAVFLDLPTVHVFDRLQYAKRRGRPGPFNHVNDVSTEGNGGESPIERTHFLLAFFVLNQEQYAFRFAIVQNSSAWGRKYKIRLVRTKTQHFARCSNIRSTLDVFDFIPH